jgi:hypothetical protein
MNPPSGRSGTRMGKLKDFRSVPTTFLTKTDNLTSGRTRQDDEEPPF